MRIARFVNSWLIGEFMTEIKLETLITIYNTLAKNLSLTGQTMDKVKELAKKIHGVDIANDRSIN